MLKKYMILKGNYTSDEEEFFIFSDGSPVMPWQARTILRKAIANLGLDEMLYGMHSLRVGHSQDLLKFNYSVDEVRMMGRWCSSCVYHYLK